MNRFATTVLGSALALTLGATAFAGIDLPLPFPPTSPGFTCQSWEFLTPSVPQPADPGWINPFGTPLMRTKGQPIWQPGFAGKEGVWCLQNQPGAIPDSLNFIVPNASRPDPKEIVMYVKWLGTDPTGAPGFPPGYQMFTSVEPTLPYTGMITRREPAPQHIGWFIDEVRFTLPYCPQFEEIKVGAFDVPFGGRVYVDWCTIYTRCIPAPGAAGLAVLAGLAASRRRRHA